MMRRLPPLLLAILFNYAIYRLFSLWITVDTGSQSLGFVATGIAGTIWFYFDDWLKESARPGEPQTIKLKTEETPNQVVWKAFVARVKIVVVAIAFVVVVFLILANT